MNSIEIDIPKYVEKVIDSLEASGFEAFVVGGCVRDSMLGITPHDWDVCTSAPPERICSVFDGLMPTIPTGIKHGTVTVLSDGIPVEVTAYRADGEYADFRRPKSVRFVDDIREDLRRRDFTVNAMAYSPRIGLLDMFGGTDDLSRGIIRCVGNAEKRFTEDALRIMRGLRFAAVYNFTIDAETVSAMEKNRALLKNISAERIWSELCGIVMSDNSAGILHSCRSVLEIIIPECFTDKNYVHENIRTLSILPERLCLRMAAILNSAGSNASAILHRLKADRKTRVSVCRIINGLPPAPPHNKRAVLQLVRQEGFETAHDIAELGKAYEIIRGDDISAWQTTLCHLNDIISNGECYSTSQLRISGKDLARLGFAGREIGEALNLLLDAVISGDLKNEPSALANYASRMIQTHGR